MSNMGDAQHGASTSAGSGSCPQKGPPKKKARFWRARRTTGVAHGVAPEDAVLAHGVAPEDAVGSVLRRFEVKDRTAESTCRGYVRDAGLRSTAGQALFVVLCLTPVLQKKRPVDMIVYEGSEDIGDKVRFLARTYTDPSTTLPRVVATADHSGASENALWVRIDKDGALYTFSRGRVGRGNDRAEKVPPFKQLREDPVGGRYFERT